MPRNQLNSLRSALVSVTLVASLGATAATGGAQDPSGPAPVTAGSVVLVGLRPGATLTMGTQGLSASDSTLEASVSTLRVQSAEAVFLGVAGRGRVSLAGIARSIDLGAVDRLRLAAGADGTGPPCAANPPPARGRSRARA